MKCPMCDENELIGKQVYCSAACRKKASRQKVDVSEKSVSKNISSSHKGHWIGKAPHKPLWTTCEAKGCPHLNAPEPDWEVTCDKVCCIDNEKQ